MREIRKDLPSNTFPWAFEEDLYCLVAILFDCLAEKRVMTVENILKVDTICLSGNWNKKLFDVVDGKVAVLLSRNL